jgi:lactose/L-arabinose transport system permease protein
MVILLTILFAFPFYFMIIGSTFSPGQLQQFPPKLLPGSNFIENYWVTIFETGVGEGWGLSYERTPFLRVFLNTMIYTVSTTIGTVILSSLAGYAFAKYTFPGKKPLFYLALITLAIPFPLIAIPIYNLLVSFGLVNTFPGAIIPWLATPVGLFLMRQSIEQNVVEEIIESARIDGANEFQILYHIVFPMVKPAIGALAVLIFVFRSNELFWPLIVLREENKQVLTVYIAGLHGGMQSPTPWGIVLPLSVIASIPVLLVFVLMQKKFIEGITPAQLKG